MLKRESDLDPPMSEPSSVVSCPKKKAQVHNSVADPEVWQGGFTIVE